MVAWRSGAFVPTHLLQRTFRASACVLALSLALGGAACKQGSSPPTLAEMQALDDSEEAGKRLISTAKGLHRLNPEAGSRRAAIVTIHGFDSRGKEWVDPLLTFADNGVEVYFFRWDDKQCPESGSKALEAALRDFIQSSPNLEKLTLIAHSYGGVIATLAAQHESLGLPVDLHVIASPLASVPKMRHLCDFSGVPAQAPADAISWHQWRTVHSADGAFKDLEVDPQRIDLPELEVTTLPEEFEGGRLGHNRSITFVSREIDPQLVETPTAAR